MGRRRRILEDAEPTTIYLTSAQRAALRRLQAKRGETGAGDPALNEVFMEGFRMLLEAEGWSRSDLERLFPKENRQPAKVVVLRKPRRS